MQHHHNFSRRRFLKSLAGLASLGLGIWPTLSVGADDYKALVCVYLMGGNDGNNMIVPVDTARYAAYQSIRGGLALTGTELLSPIADTAGNGYALHYGMVEMNPLYEAGSLAFVLNTGMLERPLTRTQFLQGQAVPSGLFSHSDQTAQTQTGIPRPNGAGWGGRLLDVLKETGNFAAISTTTPALFLQGQTLAGNTITPGSDLSLWGMSFWPAASANARRQALDAILQLDGGNPVRAAANRMFADGLQLADALKSVDSTLPALSTKFPGTSLGNQMKEVTRLIRIRSKMGAGRQVFFCMLEGFDTHGGQDWQHWSLLSQLSQALAALQQAMVEVGLENQVTAFTQSEFGRTLQPNSTGSDHAWGNHQLVLGGAVRGGIYGEIPELALGGPDDANSRGVWIPKISTSQFGATLGRWFGVAEADLATVFPGLGQFPTSNLGFMQS